MLKLIIKEEIDLDFTLIAINSILEDYKLAFLINKLLPFQLSKSLTPFTVLNNIEFEFYKHENEEEEIFWYLIPNKNKIKIFKEDLSLNLFDEPKKKIKQYIKPNYLIKITDCNINSNKFLEKLKQTNQIFDVNLIKTEDIKQNKHLIF